MECCTRASSLQHTNTHTHTHAHSFWYHRQHEDIWNYSTTEDFKRRRSATSSVWFHCFAFCVKLRTFLIDIFYYFMPWWTNYEVSTHRVCLDKQRTFACMACNGATRALTQTQTHGSYSTWARVSRLPWFMASRGSKKESLGINGVSPLANQGHQTTRGNNVSDTNHQTSPSCDLQLSLWPWPTNL